MRNDQTGSQRLACRFKNGHEGKVIWWKIRDCLTALGVSVQNFLGGSVNLLRNDRTGSQRLACRFENGLEGQVIWWKRRYWLTVLGVLVRKGLGGGRLGRLDRLGGPNGERAVRADRRLREGGRNGSATIVSWEDLGGGKQWLSPIALVLQGSGVFFS